MFLKIISRLQICLKLKIWWGSGYLATILTRFTGSKKSEKNLQYSQNISLQMARREGIFSSTLIMGFNWNT